MLSKELLLCLMQEHDPHYDKFLRTQALIVNQFASLSVRLSVAQMWTIAMGIIPH